jgi:hypothetical protein
MSALPRARAARPKPSRAPSEAPIDPNAPGARARILARFPAVLRGLQLAPAAAGAIVAEYVEARDLAKACSDDQEAAGSALALLVGDAEGFVGDGYRVTWLPCEGRTDWHAYASALEGYLIALSCGIRPESAPNPESYRGAPTRTLRVTLASGARK